MKPLHKYIVIFIVALNIFAQVFYWGYFRQEITFLYHSESIQGFWGNMIETFYPRFFVEKHRFNLVFFLQKAEQILWRLALLSFLLSGVLIFLRKNLFAFFENIVLEHKKVFFLQILLTLGWVYESFTWYKSLLRLSYLKELYEPYWLLHFVPFPDAEDLFFYFSLLYLFFLLSFIRRVAAIFWAMAVALLVILMGFLYGFSKIDHTYATWLYVSLLLPFLLQNREQVDAWALRLMQCVVAGVYLQAGLEKLFISGWAWFSPLTLKTHLLLHPTALGLQIAESPLLCILGSWFMIIFQIGFVSILFFPKLKYIFLPAGVLFHLSTFILMNVGGLVSYWYLVYVIYLLGEKKTKPQ